MEFGLFDTLDDSILETGNRSLSKNFKRIIWQTNNLDADTAEKGVWVQDRRYEEKGPDGKKTGDFEVRKQPKHANPNTAVSLHETAWAAQQLQMRRTPEEGGGPSAVVTEGARAKREERASVRSESEQFLAPDII